MVSPNQQRAAADYLGEHYRISQRRICRVLGRSRSILRYRRKHRADEPALNREIKRLARRHPRYGYRFIHALLVRRGWTINLKRVRRLWIELGLKRPVRLKKPRKLGPKLGTSANSCVNQPALFKNDVWTCDFIHDRTANGRSLKWLTLVDEYTRECLVLHADASISGTDVRRIVARVIGRRGAPTRIRSDNGSEFICDALLSWLPGVARLRCQWLRAARGRMDISNCFTVDCVMSFSSGCNLRTWQMPERRRRGTGENIMRSGLTAPWVMRRRKSSAQLVT